MFNRSFYEPTEKYTREQAEAKMREKGYRTFTFTGCSHSNGSSFYFDLPDGQKVRVSDHALTGSRAFDYIQVRFVEPKTMSICRK